MPFANIVISATSPTGIIKSVFFSFLLSLRDLFWLHYLIFSAVEIFKYRTENSILLLYGCICTVNAKLDGVRWGWRLH